MAVMGTGRATGIGMASKMETRVSMSLWVTGIVRRGVTQKASNERKVTKNEGGRGEEKRNAVLAAEK
jgi:hypothetical protein